mgnify:CR=1 FL=1
MKRNPLHGSCGLIYKVLLTSLKIVKDIVIKYLHNSKSSLKYYLILGGLVAPWIIQARPIVGVIPVHISYPSNGLSWLGLFLQDELSLQIQMNDRVSVISPDSLTRWYNRLKNSDQSVTSFNELDILRLSKIKPNKLIKISVQKVLNQLSVTLIIKSYGETNSIKKIKNIHPWLTPKKLISALIDDIRKGDKVFGEISFFHSEYTWKGIKSFYDWKQKLVPKINSFAWKEHKDELDALILMYPSLSARMRFSRAMLLILESSIIHPAHVPSLNSAEKDILAAMKVYPGNASHHCLLSLLYYLRKDKLFTKQQANIANKINPGNGLALILYGLTIGKSPKDGVSHIRKGLELYPFVGEPSYEGWQPYHLLVKDLEPWIKAPMSRKAQKYEQLLSYGRESYNSQIWPEARQAFEDASALEPTLAEPLIYLAKLELAEQDLESALSQLTKLEKRFPLNEEIKLYLGYSHEKLKNYDKSESLYHEILEMKPNHHKAMLRLGAVLIKRGKRYEARSFMESLTEKYPMYTVAWWNLGIVYYQLGQLKQAEYAWEESLRLEPDNNQMRIRLEQLRDELY